MEAITNQGMLIVISGPSGVGKTTLVNRLLETTSLPLELSVSATSRKPRPGEVDGKEYYFLSEDQFQTKIDQNEFLEYATVHGNRYGTLQSHVEEAIKNNRWVILEIDTQGFLQVKKLRPDCLSFFIRTGSLEDFEHRLRNRQTESDEEIDLRVQDAIEQLKLGCQYDFQIVNETVDQAIRTLETLIMGEQAIRRSNR